jgi:abhydrolase domain-containing protein 6
MAVCPIMEPWQSMKPTVRKIFDIHFVRAYRRPDPLILVNGLAEQSESWFANRVAWTRHFDVKVPEILVYDSDTLHRHVDRGGEVTIDYLTDRLAAYLDEYVQHPPYHFVGSSLGGQLILNYAVRHPGNVAKFVLICPSGLHGEENLPMMEGIKRSQYDTLVKSVFHHPWFATEELVDAIAHKFQDRKWKKGVLRTLRGTVGHSVQPLLERVPHACLIIWGANDKIIADIPGSIRAADRMLRVRQVVIPNCGHAPQIEKARLVNQLVVRFLRDQLKTIPPALDPRRFLLKEAQRQRRARRKLLSARP